MKVTIGFQSLRPNETSKVFRSQDFGFETVAWRKRGGDLLRVSVVCIPGV